MKLSGIFKLSIRTYRVRPLRTFLTIFGMGIGMSAVIFLVSLGNGLQKELLQKIVTSDTAYTLTVRSPQGRESLFMTSTKERAIREIPGVIELSGARIFEGSVKMNGLVSNFPVIFSDERYLSLSGAKIVSGKRDSATEKNAITITTGAARVFGKDPSSLPGEGLRLTVFSSGKEVFLRDDRVLVSQSFTVGNVVQSEDRIAYVPIGFLGSDADFFPYSEFRVRAQSQTDLQAIRNVLIDRGYDVSAIADVVRQINIFFIVVQCILGFFGIIALFVSAVGMFNTMTVTLLERTQEIGIMKAIGASDRYVAVLFVVESFLMGVCGGILGIGVAYFEMEAINGIINAVAERFGGQSMHLFSTPTWFLVLIFVFSGMVGIVTGFVPAKRASRLDTLEAMQYK